MATAAEVEPFGPVAAQLELLKRSLAHCYYWRTFTGGQWSVEEAAGRIYTTVVGYPPANVAEFDKETYEKLLPYILIHKEGSVEWKLDGEPASTTISGGLTARIVGRVPPHLEDDRPSAIRLMDNRVGLIVQSNDFSKPGLYELSANAHQGYLHLKDVTESGPFEHDYEHEASRPPELLSILNLEWGSES